MALITEIKPFTKDRHSVHGSVECGYSVFTGLDRKRYL
jgi:hypothetical protein